MPLVSEYGTRTVADVWAPLEWGSFATATTVRPVADVVTVTESGAAGGPAWPRTLRAFPTPWQITVRVSVEAGDVAAVRHVAATLEPLLLRDALEVARPAGDLPDLKLTGIDDGDVLLVDAGRFVARRSRPRHADPDHRSTDHPATGPAASPPARTAPPPPAPALHARLAQELRDSTGLPAATLGGALGVTREQYQRWLRGDPISTVRHGQLTYLHTIAADAARRLGAEQARVWWRTPAADGVAPAQRLRDRLIDRVHRLVSALPDRAPVVNDVLVALPVQQPLDPTDDDPDDDLDEDGVDSWSPYREDGLPRA